MRTRIMAPILILLIVFCGALGFAVYSNVTAAASEQINQQLDERLISLQNALIKARQNSGTLRTAQIEDIVQGIGSSNGGVFVVNEKGVVIADSQQVLTGEMVSSEGWYQQALAGARETYSATYGQTEVVMRSFVLNSTLLVSYVPGSTVTDLTQTPLYLIGVVGIIGVVLMGLLCYFLVTRLLINPIESLDEQLEEYAEGKPLDYKPLRLCPEIKESAEQLNEILEQATASRRKALSAAMLATSEKPAQVSSAAELPVAEEAGASAPLVSEDPSASEEESGQLTRFDLTLVFHEIVEQCRDIVTSKNLKFSLLFGNDVPQVIVADKNKTTSELLSCLSEVLSAALPQSEIIATVALESPGRNAHASSDTIIFEIRYDGRASRVFIRAKGEATCSAH